MLAYCLQNLSYITRNTGHFGIFLQENARMFVCNYLIISCYMCEIIKKMIALFVSAITILFLNVCDVCRNRLLAYCLQATIY